MKKSFAFVCMISLLGFALTYSACPSMDLTGDCEVKLDDFSILASEWLTASNIVDLTDMTSEWLTQGYPEDPEQMVWVFINDPGVDEDGDGTPDHPGFNGEISKYEVTTAQYCQYLNAAKADGLITVNNNGYVYEKSNFQPKMYCVTAIASSYSQITYSDGIFGVRSRDGYSMANHPLGFVTWNGAKAFCNYYGYRLPTEWEWQAVADYDGSYTYGCGTTINQSKANYKDGDFANPIGLSSSPYTSPVNYYPSYGYGMNDMAGNMWEWTDSCYYDDCNPDDRVLRGGCWFYDDRRCPVSYANHQEPVLAGTYIGFRVCR